MTNTALRRKKLLERLEQTTTVVGIDPDLHNTGVAVVRPGRVAEVHLARSPRVKGQDPLDAAAVQLLELRKILIRVCADFRFDLAIVESQFIPPNRAQARNSAAAHANPNDLIALAHVTGAAAMVFGPKQSSGGVRLLKPSAWKGNIPKEVHQARLLDELPRLRRCLDKLPESLRTHAIDAAGLAWFGLVEHAKATS